ncbi:MAG: hypothetical protein ACK5XA_14885, partial [Tagaea sp.]
MALAQAAADWLRLRALSPGGREEALARTQVDTANAALGMAVIWRYKFTSPANAHVRAFRICSSSDRSATSRFSRAFSR